MMLLSMESITLEGRRPLAMWQYTPNNRAQVSRFSNKRRKCSYFQRDGPSPNPLGTQQRDRQTDRQTDIVLFINKHYYMSLSTDNKRKTKQSMYNYWYMMLHVSIIKKSFTLFRDSLERFFEITLALHL